jgi:AcrR family transcriptional regulator
MTEDRVGPPQAEAASSGTCGVPRRFPTPNVHEQIHAATAKAVAESGCEAASVEAICALAEIPPSRFREHFAGKLEAVLSAVEAVADHVMADCQYAFVAAESAEGAWSWPEGVWAVVRTFTDWAACEPSFARLAIVELPNAGPQGEELMRELIDAFALFLAPGYSLLGERAAAIGEDAPAIGSLDAEVGAKLLQRLQEHIERDSPQTLPSIVPDLVQIALAAFIGAAAAERFVAERLAAEDARRRGTPGAG